MYACRQREIVTPNCGKTTMAVNESETQCYVKTSVQYYTTNLTGFQVAIGVDSRAVQNHKTV